MDEVKSAFVSHATADQERFVTSFATKLLANGVKAWYSGFELGPGDSLVDKVFAEGIGPADALVVVLSENSIDSEWVHAELNAGIVRRIEERMKLIPVVLDNLDRGRIPVSIRDALYIRVNNLQDYDAEVDSIVKSIYDIYERPPLGVPPIYTQASGTGSSGLASVDALVLRAACEIALAIGDIGPGVTQTIQKASEFGITADEVKDALDVLDGLGYIEATRYNGDDRDEIGFFTITSFGFKAYAQGNLPTHSKLVGSVAALIVNENERSSGNMAQALGEQPMVIEFILDDFVVQRHIDIIKFEQGGSFVSNVRPSLKRLVANG